MFVSLMKPHISTITQCLSDLREIRNQSKGFKRLLLNSICDKLEVLQSKIINNEV